ncbi:MAG: class I SAM-dependent methyltransferase [Anaerolineae bacterium]|nr:class I SAM-dependent methyltransferase [Anaerolineae bacterium]
MEQHLETPLHKVLAVIQDRTVMHSSYFGIQTQKHPYDFWVYQELLFELQPDVIVEIGNLRGGSILALAHLCDNLGKGRLIGVDISHAHIAPIVRAHPRITLIEGDACAMFEAVSHLITPADSVLVIEDSSHTFDNTLNVLNTYAPLIKVGGYFIVEDSICHHGIEVGPNPGPYEAIDAFLAMHWNFQSDRSREAFMITWNPKGYLKRIR